MLFLHLHVNGNFEGLGLRVVESDVLFLLNNGAAMERLCPVATALRGSKWRAPRSFYHYLTYMYLHTVHELSYKGHTIHVGMNTTIPVDRETHWMLFPLTELA